MGETDFDFKESIFKISSFIYVALYLFLSQ